MKRIDMHTHVFNARYVPIAGVLHQRGGILKPIARAIAKGLNAITGDQIGPRPRAMAMAAQDATIAAAELAAPANPARSLAIATPPELIDDPEVREALAILTPPGRVMAAMSENVDSASASAQFEKLYQQVERASVDDIWESGKQLLAWLRFLTRSEQVIVDTLLKTYGKDVQFFIHHMMDMEHYYDPRECHYDFVAEQLGRMKRLVDANKGRLLTFVAWSPRRANGVSIVRRALNDGIAVGVKVYPPSGYQPDEAINDGLFDLCAELDAPIFAHCSPGGMEAREGFGVKSDPAFWRNVLLRKPEWNNLRLCLGHAGGSEPWFGVKPFPNTFTQRAMELAVDPRTPNVYLEFGFHTEILKKDFRKKFAAILAQQIAASNGVLGDHIVYGTDWHMIHRLPKHETYFELFKEVFDTPALKPFANKFFFENAARFLNLPRFAERRAKDDPVRVHVERVARAAGVDAPQDSARRTARMSPSSGRSKKTGSAASRTRK